MKDYLELMRVVLKTGTDKQDRTSTGTLSVFSRQLRFNMADGFPLITTKKVHWKSVVHELLWFISGDTNVKYLNDNGVTIWDAWADKKGNLGPVYGKQWRKWTHLVEDNDWIWDGQDETMTTVVEDDPIDQLADVIKQIKTTPNSRRLIVSSWNVGDLRQMALPPCHCLFQFYVANGKLDLQLYQRSSDLFLGVPFNIASYSLLLHMVAQVTGLIPGEFIWTSGDTHIYKNHLDQCKEQISRVPKTLPSLELNPRITSIDDFKFDDIKLVNYDSHPGIKASVSV